MIDIEGRLGSDPELRFTKSGTAFVTFSVAVTDRKRDGDQWVDGDTSWFQVTAWKNLAQNIADSLVKGDLVAVKGRMSQRSWVTQEGEKRTAYGVSASMVAVPLNVRPVEVQRSERRAAARPAEPEQAPVYDPGEEPFF